MRELDENTTLQLISSPRSIEETETLKASFYFWYAGTSEEKSISSLLRSLTHQLLEIHPEIIDNVISEVRWEAALSQRSHLREWDQFELSGVLSKTVQFLATEGRILLFIDGLDEHDGPDEERQDILDLLQNLTENQGVKACVSSRPWNIFRDALQECPQLHLEDLSKGDISLYVHDKLGHNAHFCRLQRRDPHLLRAISYEIVDKARGVFLWVRLVVRDLLRVLRDGGRSKALFKELDNIPIELDEYFQRMFESIEKPYRREASIILQIALCDMDEDLEGEPIRDHGSDFLLQHLYFLDESDNQCFAAKSPEYPVGFDDVDIDEVQDFLEPLERTLVSRSMGLLEIGIIEDDYNPGNIEILRSRGKPELRLWRTRVEFLHRTVRDYFATPAAKRLLDQFAGGPFDAHMFRCNLLVTNMIAKESSNPPSSLKYQSAINFLVQILSRPPGEEAAFLLFDKMVEMIGDQVRELDEVATGNRKPTILGFHLIHWLQCRNHAMLLAIELGWTTYVQSRLTSAMLQEQMGRPFLDYALRPEPRPHVPARQDVVELLLLRGACPDATLENGIPIWLYFLADVCLKWLPNPKKCLNTITALLSHGISTCVTLREVIEVVRDEVGRPEPLLRANALRPRSSVDETMAKSDKGLFSFLDMLQVLPKMSEHTSEDMHLLSDADMAMLKSVVETAEHRCRSVHCYYSLPVGQ